MYSPASIKPLSKAQLSKLLKGKPVRVMSGSGMKLHLSKPQHKKLAAAHKRGGGMNLQLDPYQCQMHAKGEGFLEDLEAFSVKALPALTEAGKKLLNLAPEVAEAVGAPQLVAPINYLVDKYVTDKSGEAEKSKARAEAAKKPEPFVVDLPAVPKRRPKPAVEPAPFVVDLPAVPRRARRSRGGNIMEDFGNASQKFLQGAMRDTPDWLKGPEKDPLAFLYGGKVKGKRGRPKKGGRLLIDEPITARQIVNTTRDFVTDPLGTLGFGLKRKVSKKKGGALVVPQQIQDMGMAHLNRVVPKEVQDLGLSALKQIGMGKPRKPMSDKQKAALAKGRAALAAKRGGALVHPKHGKHKKMSGSALYPAGYKGSALMPAGY
jgi:hypothetical protein